MFTSSRIKPLDSLRGVAALIVVVAHCHLIDPSLLSTDDSLLLTLGPSRIVLASYASVILFFVLSGYVLSIPFSAQPYTNYFPYLVKRICRIYLPFLASVLGAAVFYILLWPGQGPYGSDWFHEQWNTQKLGLSSLAANLSLSGVSKDMWLDKVTWSLVYELRVSLVFPAVALLCNRTLLTLILIPLVYVAAVAGAVQSGNGWALQYGSDVWGTMWLTVRFATFFAMGALLANNNSQLRRKMNDHRLCTVIVIILSLILFTLPPEIHNAFFSKRIPDFNQNPYVKYCVEFLLGLASCVLIAAARNVQKISDFLSRPQLIWLGKISYSLYLVHLPVLFLTFRYTLGILNVYLTFALGLTLSLLSAELFFRFVEIPAIRLGKLFSRWLNYNLKR